MANKKALVLDGARFRECRTGDTIVDPAGAALGGAPGGSEAFPVGSVFIAVVSTDPATLLGYGTWSAIAAGRVLVGIDSGDTDFDTVEETGGAKTVASAGSVAAPTISGNTADESSHTHGVGTYAGANVAATIKAGTSSTTATGAHTTTITGTSGAGSAHNHGAGTLAASAPAFTGSATSVVQPYLVVYMWKRTA